MIHPHHSHGPAGRGALQPPAPGAIDPVCGMTVDPAAAKGGSFEHRGVAYHFCNPKCREKFAADPERYLQPRAPEPVVAGAIYTCPMHPEVRQEGPGTCPYCGMALEPEMPSLEEEENPELRDFSRRLWWTLPLTAAVFVLGMFGHLLPALPVGTRTWLELVLATPVVLWAGWPFFERCVQSIRNRSPNM